MSMVLFILKETHFFEKNPLRHKSVSTTKNTIKTTQVISSCGFWESEQKHYKDFCFPDNRIAGNKKIIKKIHLCVTVISERA